MWYLLVGLKLCHVPEVLGMTCIMQLNVPKHSALRVRGPCLALKSRPGLKSSGGTCAVEVSWMLTKLVSWAASRYKYSNNFKPSTLKTWVAGREAA